MKVVRVFQNKMDAEIANGFLASQGIRGVVSTDDEGGFNPSLGAQQGSKLLVPSESYDEAFLILKSLDEVTPLKEGE